MVVIVLLKKQFEVYHNSRIKYYADGTVKLSVANGQIYKDSEYVLSDKSTYHSSIVSSDVDEEIYLERKYKNSKDSIKRSKDKVFDIVKMNSWDFFFTGTLSDTCCIDRYDVDSVCKKVNQFMYNLVKRGKVKSYIFVPELHKDGAVHYHGFVNLNASASYTLAVNPKTGKALRRGKNRAFVFNWDDWKFGFTTLIHTYNDIHSMACYFSKYITKGQYFPMKHRYYAGGDLIRSVPTDYVDLDFDSVPCDTFHSDFGYFKYISFKSVDDFTDFLLCMFSQYQIDNFIKGGLSYVV